MLDDPLITNQTHNKADELLGEVLRHEDGGTASHGCVEVKSAHNAIVVLLAEKSSLQSSNAKLREALRYVWQNTTRLFSRETTKQVTDLLSTTPATEENETIERCGECGTEFSLCGEQGVDGIPTLDCLVCKVRSERDQARAELENLKTELSIEKQKGEEVYAELVSIDADYIHLSVLEAVMDLGKSKRYLVTACSKARDEYLNECANHEQSRQERDQLKQQLAEAKSHERRLRAMMPLFEEARDALPAVSQVSARLRNIRLDLADRMDAVGNPEKWAVIDSTMTAERK